MNTNDHISEEIVNAVLSVVDEEKEKHDNFDDITDEMMSTVPNKLVAETDQDVVIGSRVGEMPKVMKLKESNKDILDVIDGKTEDKTDLLSSVVDGAESDLGLSDEEAEKFGEVVLRYRSGEEFNYYAELPEPIKAQIRSLAIQLQPDGAYKNIRTMYNIIAENLMAEFMDSHELEDIFVDFDKSIRNAMSLPSAANMYLDNMHDTMTTKIAELAEKTREEDPEKADTLLMIKKAYEQSTTFERLIEAYKSTGRVRKAVRRDVDKVQRYCDEYNFRNKNSIFKMSDCNIVTLALRKVLIEDKKMIVFTDSAEELNKEVDLDLQDIDEVDVAKFIVLLCKSSENLDPHNIVDAAYMYYSMKNIIMLMESEQTKTSFAAELISNIVDVIKLIRNTEVSDNDRDVLRKPSGKRKRK